MRVYVRLIWEAQRTSRPIKYSTIVYSIDLDNDNQNTIHNFNDKSQYINFLSLLKKRFIKHTIPNSIMIFIIAYITFILSLIIFGIAEYILSKDIANKLTLFIDFVIAFYDFYFIFFLQNYYRDSNGKNFFSNHSDGAKCRNQC